MRMPRKLREFIAIHEAGHAIVMVAQGEAVEYATIRPSGDSLGHVKPSLGNRGDVLASIAAGAAAVELYQPNGNVEMRRLMTARGFTTSAPVDGDDDQLAQAFVAATRPVESVLQPISSNELYSAYIAAGVRAIAILERHWPAVMTVAHELLRHHSVNGKRITEILNQFRHRMIHAAANVACEGYGVSNPFLNGPEDRREDQE